jgi:ATP-binding cassette subfamily C protein CydCD
MGELMAQGPQADEALRMAVMLDVRTGTVATLPLVLVLLARVTTWWLALALVGFTACSIPWYVIVGRRSARQALALNERRVVTTTRVVRAVASVPTLRGLGATDVAVVDVASATLREHDEAQRAIHAALGSSAISEFLAGVGVGLVAMILGFSLFRRSGLTGLHVRDAVIGVVLTAQFFTTWRSRGADFHARETVAATLGALRLPAQPPASGFQIQGRDVVTRAHGQPVSFAWTDGDIVHVQGPSGIGKSSLLEVAMGLALVEGGTLTATLPHPVFRVDTATALFATSVRDNITLGRDLPDLHDVCASLDLLALLERLDYPIAQLSDGERVRVLLARALAGPSGAIVLDDFTGTLEPNYHEVLRQLLANANTHFILEAGHGPWLTTPTKSVELR